VLLKTQYFGRNGANPILYAALSGHLSCIQFLLKNNADVNSQAEYALAVNVFVVLDVGCVYKVDIWVMCWCGCFSDVVQFKV
jgi:hypothetical protein